MFNKSHKKVKTPITKQKIIRCKIIMRLKIISGKGDLKIDKINKL